MTKRSGARARTVKILKRAALIASLDPLLRMSSNPFFPYLTLRIEAGIGAGVQVRLGGRS